MVVMEVKENTISILVNNKPDVLARIAGTFSGRGFNIESISANVTMNPEITKIIITTIADRETVIKLEKLLNRLHDILQVDNLTGLEAARREMVLVRMKASGVGRSRIMELVAARDWKLVGEEGDMCIVEITGEREDIEGALAVLAPLGMKDFTRTGTVALSRNGT
jgi:acetolactate synthase I/III small subunit